MRRQALGALLDTPSSLRFRVLAAVMEYFVSAAERGAGIRQLSNAICFASCDIRKACRSLLSAGVIAPASRNGCWVVAADPGSLTLADVWRIACADMRTANRKLGISHSTVPATQMDLLITQALMELERDIIVRLASFHLDVPGEARKGFRYVSYASRRRLPDTASTLNRHNNRHAAPADSVTDTQAELEAA